MAIKSDIMAAALRKSSTPLAHSNSGNGNLRPETLGVTRREGSPERANPTAETGSPRTGYGNVALFPTHGNHVGLRGSRPLARAFANRDVFDLTPHFEARRLHIPELRRANPALERPAQLARPQLQSRRRRRISVRRIRGPERRRAGFKPLLGGHGSPWWRVHFSPTPYAIFTFVKLLICRV